MKDNKLTPKALKQIEKYNIAAADILYVSPVDLLLDSEYISGYAFITEKYFGVCTISIPKDYTLVFRSMKPQDVPAMEEIGDYEITLYDIKKLAHLHLERGIASVILTAEYDGEPVRITAFTNTYLERMNGLVRMARNVISGEAIETEPDKEEAESDKEEDEAGEKPEDKPVNKKTIFGRTLKYFFRYKGSIIVLFMVYALSAAVGVVWPYLTGKVLFDHVLERDDVYLARFGVAGQYMLALVLVAVIMVGSRLIAEIANIIQMAMMARIATATVRDIQTDVFGAMSRLSLNFFTSKQTGGLMTRVQSDSEKVIAFFIDGLPQIIVQGLSIIVTFIVMYRLNWQMALIACILLPLLVFMTIKLRPGLWMLSGRRHRAEKAVNGKANDNLNGARVIKSFGQEEKELERFASPNEKLKDAEINIVKLRNRFTILYQLVMSISSIWIWIVGVFFVLQTKQIELGVLITFVGYVQQLNGPMNFFAWVFRTWAESINSAERLFEIIDAIPEITESKNPVKLDKPRGEIELRNVTFGYSPTRPVLKNINLKVREGEMLGIVGRSGAGKSTMVNLISRLYDVNEGNILIDGTDVKELAFRDLRRNVAMVSQDTFIFMGSVAMNIAYGNENASRADIIRAAKLASAHDFISKMPDGYDTIIGASGKNLSGGEKQRISIARAILADPKIQILDEATASVDTETEKAIQNSIRYLVKGRTVLSIAHRLSTLRDADRLIVIENGRIVEEGTHDELYKLEDGIFHKLSELQNKALSIAQF